MCCSRINTPESDFGTNSNQVGLCSLYSLTKRHIERSQPPPRSRRLPPPTHSSPPASMVAATPILTNGIPPIADLQMKGSEASKREVGLSKHLSSYSPRKSSVAFGKIQFDCGNIVVNKTHGTSMSIKVFISYAHKDESHKDSLVEHLTTLRRNKIISEWNDRQIVAGQDWKGQISQNLEEAQLILFLVSSTFIASEYCFDVEFGRALEKHKEGTAELIPIIIRPCDWTSTNLGPFQGLPKDAQAITSWSDADAAWMSVIDGIKRRLELFKPKDQGSVTEVADVEKKN